MKPSLSSLTSLASGALNAVESALHPRILWPAALSMAFVISLVSSLMSAPGRPATLWFPAHTGDGSVSELRFLKRSPSGALAEALVAEELILGPMNVKALPLSVPSVGVNLVKRGRNALYVDLSLDLLFGRTASDGVSEAPPVEPARALALIRKTMGWNFPRRPLVLTVGGLEPETATVSPKTALEAAPATEGGQ